MKRVLGISTRLVLTMAAPAALLVSQPYLLRAQSQAAPVTIHGKVTNAAGLPMHAGEVKLTNDKNPDASKRVYQYSFPIDSNGMFQGSNIAPGEYLVIVEADKKLVDYQNLTFKAGENRTVDFDMTREEFLKSMSPEDRKALEEYKAHNAAAAADNAKIANINQVLTQARADEKSGKADDAVKALTGLTQQRPTEPILWASLGEAQLSLADANAKAARTAKTDPNAPAIQQNYADAAASYQKSIELNQSSKKASPELLSASYLNLGQALAKSGKAGDAATAYENAVKAQPSSAGSAYYNEAAIFYNAGKLDDAAAAADKAITADPKRAEAYYIKGQALIPKATVDAKTNKIIAPPGCIEAYQEYLELAPDGPHAADVKGILTGIGAPIQNSFKAGRKK